MPFEEVPRIPQLPEITLPNISLPISFPEIPPLPDLSKITLPKIEIPDELTLGIGNDSSLGIPSMPKLDIPPPPLPPGINPSFFNLPMDEISKNMSSITNEASGLLNNLYDEFGSIRTDVMAQVKDILPSLPNPSIILDSLVGNIHDEFGVVKPDVLDEIKNLF